MSPFAFITIRQTRLPFRQHCTLSRPTASVSTSHMSGAESPVPTSSQAGSFALRAASSLTIPPSISTGFFSSFSHVSQHSTLCARRGGAWTSPAFGIPTQATVARLYRPTFFGGWQTLVLSCGSTSTSTVHTTASNTPNKPMRLNRTPPE